MAITTAQIQQLYVAYLGRAADKAGLDYWSAQLNGTATTPATLTLENLRANFVNEQPEYTNAYAGLTRAETVSKIYLQLFGRPADATGAAYWTTGGGASVTVDQLLQAFINGASAADAKVVANKVLVAEVYTSAAGANYAQADAKSIIADVDGTTGSVTTALTNLESLPGIAIPAGVAAVKAVAVADAAVVSYEASKAASLVSLNDKLVTLNTDYAASAGAKALTPVTDTDKDGTVSYQEAKGALTNAQVVRDNISLSTTATLQANAKNASDELAVARKNLVDSKADAVALINAYNDAVKANAAVKAPTQDKIDLDTGALQGVIGSTAANTAAFKTASDAYVAAGGKAVADADALFTEISKADAATLAKIDAAFNTGVFASTYTNVKADGVAAAAKLAAEAKLEAAEGAVGSAYVGKAEASAAADKIVADAQAADALVSQATAETTAHTAVTDAVETAQKAVDATGAVNVDSKVSTDTVTGVANKADLFYFGEIKTTNDFSIEKFDKGDAIYIGEGYTFNSSVKVDANGFYTGTNTAAKEVFFIQETAGADVKAVIEINAVGHAPNTGDADNVAVITLTGITNLSDVSYANGVITSNHAAA